MTDPLAERLGILARERAASNPTYIGELLAAEVRAFLAERVTWQKIDDAISGTNKREASAVLALLRREVGG